MNVRSGAHRDDRGAPVSFPPPRPGRFLRAIPLAVVCLGGVLFSGCWKPEPVADVVIVNGNEPESLDPAIVTGISEMRITKSLFEGLLRLDPHDARPIPGLAESWTISPDGRNYIFHLRTNALWSTGEPITSRDVIYSWLRALDPATAADYAGQLFYLKNAEDFYLGKIKDSAQVGIHTPDPWTVQVELNAPVAFFLELCTFSAFGVVPQKVIEKYGDRWLHQRPLPCSGPFELVAWKLNDKVRIRKNPRYWDAAHTGSEIIDILPIGSPNAALNLYETGIADIVWDKDLVPVELLDILTKRPDFHTFSYLGTYFYRFNVTRKPFDDRRVRQAFAFATDKGRIVHKLTQGGEKPANHFVPDGVAHYTSPELTRFDLEKARALLAEAGFPGGRGFPPVQYTFYSGAGGSGKMQEKIAVEIQQMWREALGIQLELRQIERKVFLSSQSRLDYDISASSWIGDYNDANTFLDMYLSNSGNNRTGWKNPQYDDLIHAANLQTDLEKRAGIFRQAEKLLVSEEAPIVPLYFYAGFNYFNPSNIAGIFQNILDEHPMQYLKKLRHGKQTKLLKPGTLAVMENTGEN